MDESLLHKMDILGPQINLRIKKNELFKSKLGGFFTVLVALLSIGAFFGFGSDLLARKSPSVMVNKLINTEPFFQISHSNFLYAIYDQASDEVFEEFDRKFYSYINHMYFAGDGTVSTKTYYMERCSQETIKKWDGYFFNKKSNYFCLPENTYLNMTGIFNEGRHSSARVQVEYCKNNTDPKAGPIRTDCYPKSFIEKNITGRIQMHYMLESSKIDNANFTNPGSTDVRAQLTNTNTNSWNRLNILFKNVEVNTDIGFLVDDWKKQVYNAIENISTDTIYSPGTNTIFSHLIANGKYKDVYTRNYIKVQNIFALMGGFVNAAMIILKLLVRYLCYPKLIDIFNGIYKYKTLDEKKQKIEGTKSQIEYSGLYTKTQNDEKVGPNLKNNFIFTPKAQQDPSSIENVWKEKQNKNYKLNIGALDNLCKPCYSANKNHRRKLKFFNLIQRKLEKVLSIENFMKISREVQFYKFFFLDDFQKKLLKVCPTPNKRKIEDQLIMETKLPSLQENKKSDSNRLTGRVLDYFINTKD